MDLIDRAMARCPGTTREQWREVSGAVVHQDAFIGPDVNLGGDAIIRRGHIDGRCEIWGGEIRGGVIWGGEIWGGVIWGGVTRMTPFFLAGYLPWCASVSGPSQLSIGCEVHTFDEWRQDVNAIAAKHHVDEATLAMVKQVIDMAEAWHAANPIEPVPASLWGAGDDGLGGRPARPPARGNRG